MTRRYPKGRLGADDDGETTIAITVHRGHCIIEFPKPTKWIGLPADELRQFVGLLQKRLAEMSPPPGVVDPGEISLAPLPPPNRVPQPLEGRQIQAVEEYGVGSWCPTPDGTGPAEAVVLHYRIEGLGEFGLRLKTPERVNELIAMLERHRNDVWPGVGGA